MYPNTFRKPKLVYIVTVPLSALTLLPGQLRYMQEHGLEVVLITSPGSELEAVVAAEGVEIVKVPMRRNISPLHDLVSFWKLFKVLRELKPDLVNAGTPKAGLLGMLAAKIARVPIRVYTLWGLRFETLEGPKRFVTSLSERLASACADQVVSVSESLRRVYVDSGLVAASKITVLGKGSINGVNVERFLPTEENLRRSEALRQRLSIPEDAPVIGFVGRHTRDKGVVELFDAFRKVLRVLPDARLLLVGRSEKEDPVPQHYVQQLKSHRQVVITGFVPDTAPYYHLMDVLAFPSYREGFPNVMLEAGAAEVPVVGYQVTGMVDAVADGVTGLLVPPRGTGTLGESLIKLLKDDALRSKMGKAARSRVSQYFTNERVWEGWLGFYREEMSVQGGHEEG